MSRLLPPGHPCHFATEFMEDPFVKNGVELYNKLTEDKERFTKEAQYSKAWEAVLSLRAIHTELALHCEKLKKEKRDGEKSN